MNYLDELKEAYDNLYTLDNKLMLEWYSQRIIEAAKGDSLLELGLGFGYTALNFIKKIRKYVIIEGSQEIIDRFNKINPEIKLEIIHGFFEEVMCQEKFDHVFMGFILEHVDDPEFILQKYKGFLKPEGSIFITVPNGESLHRRFGYEAGLLDGLTKLTDADKEFGHKRVFTKDSIIKLVESQGYKVVNIEGVFLKPITTQQIIDLKLSKEILQAMLKVGIDYPELCNGILLEILPTKK